MAESSRPLANPTVVQAIAAIYAGGGDVAEAMLFESLLTSTLLLTIEGADAKGVWFPVIMGPYGLRAVPVYTDFDVAPAGSYRAMPFRQICRMIGPSNCGVLINRYARDHFVPAVWVRAVTEGKTSPPNSGTVYTERITAKQPILGPARDASIELLGGITEVLASLPTVLEAYLLRHLSEGRDTLLLGVIIEDKVADEQRGYMARDINAWVRPFLGEAEIDFLFDTPAGKNRAEWIRHGPAFYRRAS